MGVDIKTGGEPETKTEQDEDIMLLGSNTFEAHLTVGAEQVQLGTVVARAQTESGKSPKQWNNLSEETRDDYIRTTLDGMRKEAGEAQEKEPSTEAEAPATKDEIAGDVSVHSDRAIGGSFVSIGGGERVRVAELSQELPKAEVPDDSELA